MGIIAAARTAAVLGRIKKRGGYWIYRPNIYQRTHRTRRFPDRTIVQLLAEDRDIVLLRWRPTRHRRYETIVTVKDNVPRKGFFDNPDHIGRRNGWNLLRPVPCLPAVP